MDEYPDLKLPTHCTGCRHPLDPNGDGTILLTESMMPDEEWTGDPTRVLGWHPGCAPELVKQKHTEVTGG